jgi:hypothetical protein
MTVKTASLIWKDGTRRGIAYVEGREIAEQVMEIAGRRTRSAEPPRRTAAANDVEAALTGAMAVYADKRGKPFAWQIPFDMRCWEAVSALLLPAGADR